MLNHVFITTYLSVQTMFQFRTTILNFRSYNFNSGTLKCELNDAGKNADNNAVSETGWTWYWNKY